MKRWAGRLLPTLAAGLGLAASLPPWGLWPLAFLGAGLLFWLLRDLSLRWRLLLGWVAGLGCYVPGLFWARSFNWYGAVVLMIVEALSMGVAAVLTPPNRGRIPAFVGAFTLLEAVRMTWPFGGLPIGGVFLGQAGGPLLALARVAGPLGLTACVWAAGAVVGTALGLVVDLSLRAHAARTARRTPWRAALSGLLVAAVLAGAVVGAERAPDGGPAQRRLQVALVQGGGMRGYSMQEVSPASVFAAQVGATDALARRVRGHAPQLVVWPEDVIALDGPLAGSPQERIVANLARMLHTTLVAGITTPVGLTQFRNQVVAWNNQGKVIAVFDKVHRVPFGEYIPYRAFFAHFADVSGVPLDAIPGHGSGLMRTPAAPLGIMVSFEVFYANRSRPSVQAGAQLLVVPTNTSSYATGQVPSQEVAADKVQAVEEGRDLVQAAPTGYSTVVDHDGNLVQRSTLSARQSLLATVALRTGHTLYERSGDLPSVAGAGVLVLLGLVSEMLWRRRKHPLEGVMVPTGEMVPDAVAPPETMPRQPFGFRAPSASELSGETGEGQS